MEKRDIEITNLLPVKPYETYKESLEWRTDNTGKRRLYLVVKVGDLNELRKM